MSLDELDHDKKMTDALETTKKSFRESLILTDVNVMEKQDVIQLASDLLYEQGFIEKGFSQEVWKRELKSRPPSGGHRNAAYLQRLCEAERRCGRKAEISDFMDTQRKGTADVPDCD